MISVVTPCVRPENLDIILKCLQRQRVGVEWEWIIIGPEPVEEWHDKHFNQQSFPMLYIKEPERHEGDYYGLNKAWNAGFKYASGDLIISIQDGMWFPPDMLEKFWNHYLADPKACVGAIGHQYSDIVNGKPENQVWQDPRARTDQGSFHEIYPNDLEFSVCSFPRQAVLEAGGIDEEYDKFAAISEKELALRMNALGYKQYLDQSIEYRAIKHPRLNDRWEEAYQAGCIVYQKHIREVLDGKRLKLNYL